MIISDINELVLFSSHLIFYFCFPSIYTVIIILYFILFQLFISLFSDIFCRPCCMYEPVSTTHSPIIPWCFLWHYINVSMVYSYIYWTIFILRTAWFPPIISQNRSLPQIQAYHYFSLTISMKSYPWLLFKVMVSFCIEILSFLSKMFT